MVIKNFFDKRGDKNMNNSSSSGLNLKTQIMLGDKKMMLELFSIKQGDITEIKLDDNVFSRNNCSLNENGIWHRNWTEKEDQVLRENFKVMTVPKIVEKNLLPGRSRESIANRAYRLKIRKYKVKKRRKKRFKNNPGKKKPVSKRVDGQSETTVKGFTEHKNKRIRELHDRRKEHSNLCMG